MILFLFITLNTLIFVVILGQQPIVSAQPNFSFVEVELAFCV